MWRSRARRIRTSVFFFSSRRRHTRFDCDWSSDVCSSDVFSGAQCGLIDFDTVCQAEPALDLGQFLAYLRLAACKAGGAASTDGNETSERVCARFLEAYMNACGYAPEERDRLQARVRLYEMVSLLRLVFHSWRKFKGARLALAVVLVLERLPFLARRRS